ncbi:MAG TPA: helix-turn-helix domain-containing protein [Candidatus Paceibacterota bacterium]|nr:helix-turn-helix domain-containing protein [Candidatus Paceibacterota bacterium]
MARKLDRQQAVELRQKGYPYPAIKKLLGVSKSTLSHWLRDVELTSTQRNTIYEEGLAKRVEKYLSTTRARRQKIVQEYYDKQKVKLLPLTERDLLMAGLFLYLGEGSKSRWFDVGVSNSNPTIIKFAIIWLVSILGADKKKIKVYLHLYSDMDIQKEIQFWKKVTGLPLSQFRKPYVKKSKFSKVSYSTFGHGTCNIILGNVKLKHEIMTGLQVILNEVGASQGRVF